MTLRRPTTLLVIVIAYLGVSLGTREKLYCTEIAFSKNADCNCPLSSSDLRDFLLEKKWAEEYKLTDSSGLDSYYFKVLSCDTGHETAHDARLARFLKFNGDYQRTRCSQLCFSTRKGNTKISFQSSRDNKIKSIKIVLLLVFSALLGGIIAKSRKEPF